MKKDRNSFFSEYGFNTMNQNMNQNFAPNMMIPGVGAPYPGGGQPTGPAAPMPTDIDSRIAKLERAINRLETRVSKLEGDYPNATPLNETDYAYNNSMYMV